MLRDLNKEEKHLFIKDFIFEFILILLKIGGIITAIAVGITLLWICINQPVYIPIPIIVVVFVFIFRAAKNEAIYRHNARENCKTRMKEAKQNIEDYQSLKDKWEAFTPIDDKQKKERENELSHCQRSIDWWKEKYDMALGEFLIKGGKFTP